MGARTELFSKKQPGGAFMVANMGVTTGNIFFVDSGNTANGGDSAGFGRNPDAPFLTIDYAIGECTANNGDRILVMPGHAETVAAASGIDFDIAGITVVGIGSGSDRPTITSSATGSTIVVDAANTTIENILFTTSAAATIMLDVNAADCVVRNCEFRMLTGVTAIDVDGGSANACDRFQCYDCVFDASTDGPDEAIHLNEVADSVIIDGCYAYGLFDDAAIHNPSGSVLTWLRITNNILVNTTAASHSIELVSASTGIIANNSCGSPLADATPGDIDGGSCHILENYSHDAGGNDSGLLNPSADS
jgi:hypothetical protein